MLPEPSVVTVNVTFWPLLSLIVTCVVPFPAPVIVKDAFGPGALAGVTVTTLLSAEDAVSAPL
jgi:hypothetical protein